MTRIAMVLAAVILVLGVSSLASADDEPTISITLTALSSEQGVEVSINGITPDEIDDKLTKDIIRKIIDLMYYTKNAVYQKF